MESLIPEQPKKKRGWPLNGTSSGLVAVILSTGVSTSMIVLVIGALATVFLHDRPISGEAATLLSTIFGTVVGAVATYLGQSKSQEENK